MALTNREKQARHRQKLKALARPHVIEDALLEEAERASELSEPERNALADKLVDAALGHMWRMQELQRAAMKVRSGSDEVWRSNREHAQATWKRRDVDAEG
jgi:hypothetical protein